MVVVDSTGSYYKDNLLYQYHQWQQSLDHDHSRILVLYSDYMCHPQAKHPDKRMRKWFSLMKAYTNLLFALKLSVQKPFIFDLTTGTSPNNVTWVQGSLTKKEIGKRFDVTSEANFIVGCSMIDVRTNDFLNNRVYSLNIYRFGFSMFYCSYTIKILLRYLFI